MTRQTLNKTERTPNRGRAFLDHETSGKGIDRKRLRQRNCLHGGTFSKSGLIENGGGGGKSSGASHGGSRDSSGGVRRKESRVKI